VAFIAEFQKFFKKTLFVRFSAQPIFACSKLFVFFLGQSDFEYASRLDFVFIGSGIFKTERLHHKKTRFDFLKKFLKSLQLL